ncbi:Holliday junction DNA helicase RuvA [Methylacidiphilum sp. Yel]|uniref:Holliday junction branch migration protein RuvA n=1 Tax=Methylacidiphilum sp. Yel TaxID=1847730 RepID=UPI00106A5175|nr:Holliday junction branch migration protein RuvA [Methylacidiphilum sp. Yel]TFE68806.1 Holliday junction DNA helicase RuvA [Methylacidiphilum sp. Yel]
MISYLKGILIYCSFPTIIVESHGIGFEIFSSLSLYRSLPPLHSEVSLYTHLNVSENRFELFGFHDLDEQFIFRILVEKVHGVGPKTAITILNVLSPKEFKEAIYREDYRALSKIKGIGEKTAHRLVVELKDKLDVGRSGVGPFSKETKDQIFEDSLKALVALGFKETEAVKLVRKVREKEPEKDLEGVVRECLKLTCMEK